MSIRPVEFHGIVQRSQDVSTLKQNEDNKPMLQQQNVQTQFAKETAQHMHQVNQANDSDNPEQKFDAREKAATNMRITGSRRKKRKKRTVERQMQRPTRAALT